MHTRKRTRSPQPSQDQNTAPKATRLQTSEAHHPNSPHLPMTDQSAAQTGTPTREQELPASPAQTSSQPSPKSTPPSAEEPSPTSSENFCWDINNSPDTQKQHLDLPENPKADSSPMADSDSSSTNINIETQTPDVIMAEDASNPQPRAAKSHAHGNSKSPSSSHPPSAAQVTPSPSKQDHFTQTHKQAGSDKSTQTTGFYLIHT